MSHRRTTPRRARLLLVLATMASATFTGVRLDRVAAEEAPPLVAVDAGAAGGALAVRLEPPPGAPGTLLFLGDSLGLFGRKQLDAALVRPGWNAIVNVKGGRGIVSDDATLSAVLTVQSIHSQHIDPDLWIVELGTNDVAAIANCGCTDKVGASVARIRRMLAAIGPGERVEWVNVENFDFPEVAIDYNQAIDNLVATGEIVAVADWHSLAHGRRDVWYSDSKHLNAAGYAAWANVIGEMFRSH